MHELPCCESPTSCKQLTCVMRTWELSLTLPGSMPEDAPYSQHVHMKQASCNQHTRTHAFKAAAGRTRRATTLRRVCRTSMISTCEGRKTCGADFWVLPHAAAEWSCPTLAGTGQLIMWAVDALLTGLGAQECVYFFVVSLQESLKFNTMQACMCFKLTHDARRITCMCRHGQVFNGLGLKESLKLTSAECLQYPTCMVLFYMKVSRTHIIGSAMVFMARGSLVDCSVPKAWQIACVHCVLTNLHCRRSSQWPGSHQSCS